jgi:hypothetical protein
VGLAWNVIQIPPERQEAKLQQGGEPADERTPVAA